MLKTQYEPTSEPNRTPALTCKTNLHAHIARSLLPSPSGEGRGNGPTLKGVAGGGTAESNMPARSDTKVSKSQTRGRKASPQGDTGSAQGSVKRSLVTELDEAASNSQGAPPTKRAVAQVGVSTMDTQPDAHLAAATGQAAASSDAGAPTGTPAPRRGSAP